jgi:hypothetical protein
MGPRHNLVHPPPDDNDLTLARRSGLAAIPLVKESRTPDGQVYYPVFLPFDARVVCPWCLKVGVFFVQFSDPVHS